MNLSVPKPKIQVQFLVGTPLQNTRFQWGFRFLRFPRGPESTALSSIFLQPKLEWSPVLRASSLIGELARSRIACYLA